MLDMNSVVWWCVVLMLLFATVHDGQDARAQAEQTQLDRALREAALPTSLAAYKNHMHFAIARHLLKFEAVRPGSAVLGLCRGEAVYARESVCTLHTTQQWHMLGRTVRAGEAPVKQGVWLVLACVNGCNELHSCSQLYIACI